MKKIFLISIFYIFFFCSNSFAFLEFKQSKDISSDANDLRGIFIKPDGTRVYVTNDKDTDDQSVIEYSLTTPFDISTSVKISDTLLTIEEGGGTEVMNNPHAIVFKTDGTEMYVIRSDGTSGNLVLTGASAVTSYGIKKKQVIHLGNI